MYIVYHFPKQCNQCMSLRIFFVMVYMLGIRGCEETSGKTQNQNPRSYRGVFFCIFLGDP